MLRYDPIDGLHQEFVACLGYLQYSGDEQLPTALDAMLAHPGNHFDEKDRWTVDTESPLATAIMTSTPQCSNRAMRSSSC